MFEQVKAAAGLKIGELVLIQMELSARSETKNQNITGCLLMKTNFSWARRA